MEVTMENAADNQVHLSQSVPMSSPLTWKLTGDIESNQIEVSQNAADSESPLDCTPECPQEEYVYDYQYAGSHLADNTDVDVDVHQEKNSFQEDYENNNIIIEDYQVSPDNSGFRDEGNPNSDVVTFQEESIPALPEVPTFQPQDQSG